jgi:hypothetical protein
MTKFKKILRKGTCYISFIILAIPYFIIKALYLILDKITDKLAEWEFDYDDIKEVIK